MLRPLCDPRVKDWLKNRAINVQRMFLRYSWNNAKEPKAILSRIPGLFPKPKPKGRKPARNAEKYPSTFGRVKLTFTPGDSLEYFAKCPANYPWWDAHWSPFASSILCHFALSSCGGGLWSDLLFRGTLSMSIVLALSPVCSKPCFFKLFPNIEIYLNLATKEIWLQMFTILFPEVCCERKRLHALIGSITLREATPGSHI